ncbi:lipopolysaccharide biosynthesis protein [Flavobacterium sp. XS2P12]|uniref:lipopolysaccharide biosynthesis protein n=1 Tax=Flavobacterium melibiosi TaxID=3398734 RepID=UPI003A889FB2
MPNTENNKRIAKNTLLLYFRMILVSLVSLFTTRIVLEQLGIENYGIYNVVAGVVGFLGMLNGSMTSATQRFLAFELGSGDGKSYNRVFSMLLTIFLSFSLVLMFVAIAIGPWLINDFIVIPNDKKDIALWVYYFSVVTFFIDLISIPYMSSIIAHEKMGIYAFMSFLEVMFKLLLAYILYASTFDKLLTYGFLTMFVTFLITLFYCVYCVYKIKGCNYQFSWDQSLYKKMLGYMGWNIFGSVTYILNTQGQTLVLNIFFGPLVNAAKAISDKINSIVVSFSTNFYMAVRPQIIKSYASGEHDYMFKLVFRSSKLSFYLLFLVTLPLIILMPKILVIWLGLSQVSDDMVLFSQLMLIYSLVNVFENPISALIQATGNIRNYQVIIGFWTLLILPISYFLFKLGFPAYYYLIVLISIYAVAHFFRLLIAKQQLGLSIKYYFRTVFAPVIITSLPSAILSNYLCKFFPDNFLGLVSSGIACILMSLTFIFSLGLEQTERVIVFTQIEKLLSRHKR